MQRYVVFSYTCSKYTYTMGRGAIIQSVDIYIDANTQTVAIQRIQKEQENFSIIDK